MQKRETKMAESGFGGPKNAQDLVVILVFTRRSMVWISVLPL